MPAIRLLLLALFLFGYHHAVAQDTIRLSFAEEQDTLFRQRFVDRYENVFMTKVPTRHMFKVGLTFLPNYLFGVENTGDQNIQFDMGYEYKVLPSWSVGAEAGVSGGWGSEQGFFGKLSGKIYGRWYYDMRRRILEGTSVNNFTGNFLALVGERQWLKNVVNTHVKRIGVEFGLQRRFFNQGRLELGIGVYYQGYKRQGEYPLLLAYDLSGSSRFAIVSRTSMGFAFGDWKKNKNQPFCEVLRCDDYVQQQWKLLWPKLYVSSAFSNGTVGLSYERKIKSSPFSVNTQLMADYMRIVTEGLSTPPGEKLVSNDFQIHSSVQLRYYVDQRKAIRSGTGGNNLSGLYVGPYTDHLFYHSETIFGEGRSKRHLGLGAGAGYQQTLFRKAYVDLSMGVSHNLLKVNENSRRYLGSIRMGFGLIF